MARTREIHDHYFREAQRLGYAARSAFKLTEILDKRPGMLRPGMKVLDLGCAPGAWMQVANQRLGPIQRGGQVVGLDLKKVRTSGLKFCDARSQALEMDVFKAQPDELRALINGALFDLVLSDMMASTTGHHHSDHHQSMELARAALGIAAQVSSPGAGFVVKVFEGESYPELLNEMKQYYGKVKGFKPKASRNESTEMFVIGEGFVGGG